MRIWRVTKENILEQWIEFERMPLVLLVSFALEKTQRMSAQEP